MRTVSYEEFEQGDKVKLGSWVNKQYCKPNQIDVIMTVEFQAGDDVYTDKGWVDYDCLELVEDDDANDYSPDYVGEDN